MGRQTWRGRDLGKGHAVPQLEDPPITLPTLLCLESELPPPGSLLRYTPSSQIHTSHPALDSLSALASYQFLRGVIWSSTQLDGASATAQACQYALNAPPCPFLSNSYSSLNTHFQSPLWVPMSPRASPIIGNSPLGQGCPLLLSPSRTDTSPTHCLLSPGLSHRQWLMKARYMKERRRGPMGHLGAASLSLIHAQFGNCPLHSPQRLDEGPSPPRETALAQAKWVEAGPLQAP